MGQSELAKHHPEPSSLAQRINRPDGPPPLLRTQKGAIIPTDVVSEVIWAYAADFVAHGGGRTKGVIRQTFRDLGYTETVITRTLAHRDLQGRDFGWHVRRAKRQARVDNKVGTSGPLPVGLMPVGDLPAPAELISTQPANLNIEEDVHTRPPKKPLTNAERRRRKKLVPKGKNWPSSDDRTSSLIPEGSFTPTTPPTRVAAPQEILARRIQSPSYSADRDSAPNSARTKTANAEDTVVYRAPRRNSKRIAMPMSHGPVLAGMRKEVVWDRGRRGSHFTESIHASKERPSTTELPAFTKFRIEVGEGGKKQIRDILLGQNQARLLRVLMESDGTLQSAAALAEKVSMDEYTFGMQFKVLRDTLERALGESIILKDNHRGGKNRPLNPTRYKMKPGITITAITNSAK